MTYRADIDGLRAVAVALVLLFHLDIEAFAGGYIGVDVFFVLSGYLITTIVWKQVEAGRFRLRTFYARRVLRLMPPLLVTIVATIVAAAVLMDPKDYAAFARTVVSSVLSVSNILFYTQAGYWDSANELKPLLHTWSLGVEEQFYLLWPAALLAVGRLRPGAIRPILMWTTAIGAIGAIILFESDPSAAFYLLPARIFQFSLGAVLGLVPGKTTSRWLRSQTARSWGQLAGVVAVGVSAVVVLTAESPYPGWRAVLPTAAAAIALVAGTNGGGGLANALLGNAAMRWLGRLSYSLYLTHWPVISLYRYRTNLELTGAEQAMLLAVSLASAAVLHYGVERRFYVRPEAGAVRTPTVAPVQNRRPNMAVAGVLGFAAATALTLSHAALGDGWAWRHGQVQLTVEAIDDGVQRRFDLVRPGCNIRDLTRDACNDKAEVQALVLGNSHEPDGYNFFYGAYGDHRDLNLIGFGSLNQCDELARADGAWTSTAEDCQGRLDNLAEAASELDVLVYSANRPFAPNKALTLDLIQSLKEINSELTVVTMGGYINTEAECSRLINETGSSAACVDADNLTYFESDPSDQPLFEQTMALTDIYIDRIDLLCQDRTRSESCRSETADGVPMSYDQHHLSLEFALESGQLFADRHGDIFGKGAPADRKARSGDQ